MIARNIIAVGASAGGLNAIHRLVEALPADLPAALFITQHLSERSEAILPDLLTRAGKLPALSPWEETPIQMGTIYVAPPDYHLLLTSGTVHLGHGPKENLQRPCINTMFRSAAAAHGERVAGVLLTGLLDDGAAGLWEIQQHGGVTVVQDPEEALYRSMPDSAIRGLNVQYIVRLAEMAPLLSRLTRGNAGSAEPCPLPAAPVEEGIQTCPECSGVMKLHRLGRLREYTCHVGHRFGLKTTIALKTENVEKALWTALSQSEELGELLLQLQADLGPESPEDVSSEITDRKRQTDLLRDLIHAMGSSPLH